MHRSIRNSEKLLFFIAWIEQQLSSEYEDTLSVRIQKPLSIGELLMLDHFGPGKEA